MIRGFCNWEPSSSSKLKLRKFERDRKTCRAHFFVNKVSIVWLFWAGENVNGDAREAEAATKNRLCNSA